MASGQILMNTGTASSSEAVHHRPWAIAASPNAKRASTRALLWPDQMPTAEPPNVRVKNNRSCHGDQVGEKGTGPICAKHPEGLSGKLDLSPFPGDGGGNTSRTNTRSAQTRMAMLARLQTAAPKLSGR